MFVYDMCNVEQNRFTVSYIKCAIHIVIIFTITIASITTIWCSRRGNLRKQGPLFIHVLPRPSPGDAPHGGRLQWHLRRFFCCGSPCGGLGGGLVGGLVAVVVASPVDVDALMLTLLRLAFVLMHGVDVDALMWAR